MIFLTVGSLFPFNRLVRTIDEAVADNLIQEEVFAQIGTKGEIPKHMEYAEVLTKDDFNSYVSKASALIGHAGMGIISLALDHMKPLLAMPRLKHFGEHVNDHQLETAIKFGQLGHILVAENSEQLWEKIKSLLSFVPKKRENQVSAVSCRIARFLDKVNSGETLNL